MKKIVFFLSVVALLSVSANQTHAQTVLDPYDTSFSSRPCLAANIIFLVDRSVTMRGGEGDMALDIQSFLDLPIDSEHVWMGIVTFGSVTTIAQPLTASKEDISREIDKIFLGE
jgi:hypothetical protein